MRMRLRPTVLLTVLVGATILFALIVAEHDSLARRAEFHADQALIDAAASRADSHGADVVEGKATSPLKAFFDPSYGGYLRALRRATRRGPTIMHRFETSMSEPPSTRGSRSRPILRLPRPSFPDSSLGRC